MYGLRMDYVWIMLRLCVDYAWVLRGLRMDYAWVMNGLCMDYVWIMPRQSQMDLKMTPASPRRAKSGPEHDASLTHWHFV